MNLVTGSFSKFVASWRGGGAGGKGERGGGGGGKRPLNNMGVREQNDEIRY
jgi:hypothetical protein